MPRLLTRWVLTVAAIVVSLGAVAPAGAQPAGLPDPVKVQALWSATGVKGGGSAQLAVVFDIEPGWHIQAAHPDDPDLVATVVKVEQASAGLHVGAPLYPTPKPVQVGQVGQAITLNAYEGRAVVLLPVTADAEAIPGTGRVKLAITYQACKEVCLMPRTVELETTLPIVTAGAKIDAAHGEIFDGAAAEGTHVRRTWASGGSAQTLSLDVFGWKGSIDPSRLWLLLGVSMVGGFLLNFTPCVLPLIPIKILSLSQAAGNRRRMVLLGVVMSVGVVAFWIALGAAISSISGFTATNQLFQKPWFGVAVGLVIAAMAVGMCGLFAVRLPQWVYAVNPSQESAAGSFGFGIMTAVLSTPCTAPFMGATAAWAATQSAMITMATFAAIGAGMALPYLLLTIFPGWIERMPRSGPASELIKQVMGLLMLGAAAFFLGTGISGWLATPPEPPTRMYWWAVAVFVAAAGVWLIWRTVRITRRPGPRVTFACVGIFFIAAAGHMGVRFTEPGPVHWVYYTAPRLAEAQRARKVVVMEFTAEWCANCKALEQFVLDRPDVAKLLNSPDVAAVKIDLTGNNVEGNAKLAEAGSRSIPLLVVLDRDGREVFKSPAYTATELTAAIRKAMVSGGVAERPAE